MFATRTSAGHAFPTSRVECYVGEPCVFQVAAVMYESSAGLPMHGFGRCDWGDSIVDSETGHNSQNSSMCVDNVRKLPINLGAEVHIDATHAALQGCPHSLLDHSTDGLAGTCHSIEHLPPNSAGSGLNEGVGVLNITLFGNRGLVGGSGVGGVDQGDANAVGRRYTRPYEFDIGRKIPMCFQARECPQCCYKCRVHI